MNHEELVSKARDIRIDIIKMLNHAGSGHPGGALAMADIFAYLYFKHLSHKPEDPMWDDRDRLFLSNGHIVPVRYAAMARAGYFDPVELNSLRQFGSRLQGHPERVKLPALESTSGPLGSGLAQAAGYAYAARMDKKQYGVYCICSDGEHQEGNHWEAVMFAAHYSLGNLVAIVDRNNIQIDGYTEQTMSLNYLRHKYEAFNWYVVEINGHSFDEIEHGFDEASGVSDKPVVVIAHTIPGKGVSFMENKPEWHGKAPNNEQARQALHELENA